MKRHIPFSRRGEQAIQAFQEADNLDATPRLSYGDETVYAMDAKLARAKAEILLDPAAPVVVSAGEAVTWEHKADESFIGAHARIIDTLEHPTSISASASSQRTSAALDAQVLEPAVDAAVSAQASNSIEKMLCHQMAAVHFAAMRLPAQGAGENLQPGDVARFTNAAARMMDVYQAGCLTLQKLKTKGTQRVLVQYQQVNVGSGGQAVVAGRVSRGSRARGRGTKNG